MFKRILGEYAPTFAGYGQHDSHECINTILDLMGEDLYRKGKKPYVENDEKPNQTEEQAAREAWNKHLLRNESIMTDLFHGQFKSTVCCSQCDRVSVTFDPWMTLSLPIPKKKELKDFFFCPYNIKQGFVNKSVKIRVGGSDNLRTLRTIMHEVYGINPGSYVVAAVFNNNFTKLHTISANTLEVASEQGATLMYEIDPSLNPSLPSQAMRADGMYGVSDEVTMLQLNIAIWQKSNSYGSSSFVKEPMLPRLLWVRKDQSLKDLHLSVFKHIRYGFSEWVDWSHPASERTSKDGKNSLRNIIAFPYRLDENEPITREQFDALSDEQAFELCFPGVLAGEVDGHIQSTNNFSIERMAYQLEFKKSEYVSCKICEKSLCRSCLVPFSQDLTVRDMLDKMGLRTNDTLFSQFSQIRGKELIC